MIKINKSVLSISTIAGISFIIASGLKYGFNFAIARIFGASVLGTITFGIVLMNVISIFGRLGLEHTLQKFIPEYAETGEDIKIWGLFIFAVVASLLTTSVLAAISFITVDQLVQPQKPVATSVFVFILSAPIFSVYLIVSNTLKGFKISEHFLYSKNIIFPLLFFVGVFATWKLQLPTHFIAVWYLLSVLCGLGYCLIALFRHANAKFGLTSDLDLGRIMSFSVASLTLIGAQYLTSWTDVLALSVFNPAADIGVYQAAFQTASLVTLVLSAANSIFPPVASSLSFKNDRERLAEVYSALTKWIFLLSSLGGVFLIFNSRTILSLFGQEFIGGNTPLILLVIANVAAVSSGPVGFLLSMSDNERVNALTTVFFAVVNLLLNIVLIPIFGVTGAAIATGAALTMLNIARLFEVYFLLGIFPYSTSYLGGLVAFSSAVISLQISKSVISNPLTELVLGGLIAGTTFVSISLIIGVDEADKALLEPLQND